MRWIALKRSKIRVRGEPLKVRMKGMTAQEEHTHFLHSLLTNNVKALKPGTFNYNLWLRPNGQPIGDFFVFRDGQSFILDTELDSNRVIDEFNRLKLSLRVYFDDLTGSLEHVFLFGEGAEDFIGERFGGVPEDLKFIKENGVIIAGNPLRIGLRGFDLIGEGISTLLPGDEKINFEEFEDLRIENRIARIGKELREGFSPIEAGVLDYAIDLNKGCYTGQEAIARVYYRGRTPRVLVKMESLGKVEEGEELISENGKRAGLITSVASNGRRCLGYVLREVLEKGEPLRTSGGNVEVKIIDQGGK
jgi:folate-binding protein YgfZ